MPKPTKWSSTVEGLEERIYAHLPSTDIMRRPLTDEESTARDEHRRRFPGADFEFVTHEGRFYIVPSWHCWNNVPPHSKGVNYAKGVIDGGSFRAVVDEDNPSRIDHGNIILAEARNTRYSDSWQALGYNVPIGEMSQAIYDLAAILGEAVLRDPDEIPSRAYIRPYGVVDTVGIGLGSEATDSIFHGLYVRNFPSYFPGKERRIYQGKGLFATVFLDLQRLEPIPGKLTRNYALVGDLTKRAKELGDDEAIILAPHGYDPSTGGLIRRFAQDGEDRLEEMSRFQHFADGPGEGLIAVKEHLNDVEVWLPPNSVNQLASTTMAYIALMAEKMGFRVIVKPFGFYEIAEGLIDNVIMVGNAVGAAPIGRIRKIHPRRGQIDIITMKISQAAKGIRDQYSKELNELVSPSHPSLLTPVYFNAPESVKAREILYNQWEQHFK